MLTKEEELHKDEIMRLTEDVLDAKGIECDASISKISEEDLREILELVRKNRKRRRTRRIWKRPHLQKARRKNYRYISLRIIFWQSFNRNVCY